MTIKNKEECIHYGKPYLAGGEKGKYVCDYPGEVIVVNFCPCSHWKRATDKEERKPNELGDKKLRMWIACCGCGNAISLVDNIYRVEDERLIYYTKCPYCGFEHKIVIQKG